MFEVCKNSNQQGNVGLAYAIAYYSRLGYIISIPLTDSQDYDLVVDNYKQLLKVQVKTTKFLAPNGNYVVNLTTNSKRIVSSNKVITFDKNSCDILFILTDNGVCYSIPRNLIKAVRALTLGNKYNNCIVKL